ncbi:VanZ family protein [Rossellomorea sp. NS-SX7]|uniref:VanZ family protein n=1 Tax=Rossellomorea sp. NS-SX7 TaxID=3463856 RepID=UPI004058AABE
MVFICYFTLIFIMTCTENLTRLYNEGIPTFRWNMEPDYSAFFDVASYPFSSPQYIFQKTGHSIAFCLLAAIVFMVVNRMGMTILISASYALFTEIAQIFFYRTGCLLDVGYDLAGVVVYAALYWLYTIFLRINALTVYDYRYK